MEVLLLHIILSIFIYSSYYFIVNYSSNMFISFNIIQLPISHFLGLHIWHLRPVGQLGLNQLKLTKFLLLYSFRAFLHNLFLMLSGGLHLM
jgi:hypothetical protein